MRYFIIYFIILFA
uniref:Uncharacterized protein n=1 Tax=Rhizophora mucronata TaxID=61149 RepID=A0A2P2PZ77_RHIMU